MVSKSLETENVSNTMSLLNISPPALILLGTLVFGEAVSVLQFIGIIVVFVGIILASTTKGFRFNSKLAPALAGDVAWAIFSLIIAYAIATYAGSPMAFLLIARVFAFSWLIVYFFARVRPKERRAPKDLKSAMRAVKIAILAEIIAGIGQAGFAFIVVYKSIALDGALQALTPVLIAIHGYVFYKERLNSIQISKILLSMGRGGA